LICPSEGG